MCKENNFFPETTAVFWSLLVLFMANTIKTNINQLKINYLQKSMLSYMIITMQR